MKLLRKPWLGALLLLFISSGYALCFWVISGSFEFTNIIGSGRQERALFLNLWDGILERGYLKYIGTAFLAISLLILLLSLIRRNYDEYQTAILKKNLVITELVPMFLFPVYLFRILNNNAYVVDYTLLLVVIHWSVILLTALIFRLRAHR